MNLRGIVGGQHIIATDFLNSAFLHSLDPLPTLKVSIIISAMKSWRSPWLVSGIVGGAVLLIVAIANLNTLGLSFAFVTAEQRPELLADARWKAPATAVRFARRFGAGSREADLVSWLGANKFQIDRTRGHARRLIKSLPCNEDVEVDWNADGQGRLGSATAEVSEAGCI